MAIWIFLAFSIAILLAGLRDGAFFISTLAYGAVAFVAVRGAAKNAEGLIPNRIKRDSADLLVIEDKHFVVQYVEHYLTSIVRQMLGSHWRRLLCALSMLVLVFASYALFAPITLLPVPTSYILYIYSLDPKTYVNLITILISLGLFGLGWYLRARLADRNLAIRSCADIALGALILLIGLYVAMIIMTVTDVLWLASRLDDTTGFVKTASALALLNIKNFSNPVNLLALVGIGDAARVKLIANSVPTLEALRFDFHILMRAHLWCGLVGPILFVVMSGALWIFVGLNRIVRYLNDGGHYSWVEHLVTFPNILGGVGALVAMIGLHVVF